MFKKQQGFTLVELMVTVIVLAILASVAVPNFINTIQNTRSTSLANSFVTALNYARSEAIKRNRQVDLCPGADPASCTGAWTSGWLITTEDSGGNIIVLRSFDSPETGANISLDVDDVGFDGRGALADPSSTAIFKTYYQSCPDEEKRIIQISVAGQISLSREACTP